MPGSIPLGSARSLSSSRPRWLKYACAGLTCSTLSFAQVILDNNNGADNSQWGTANNWNPNAVPANTANIVFGGTEGTDATVNNVQLRGNRTINNLTFTNVDDTFSLINGNGNRTLTISLDNSCLNRGKYLSRPPTAVLAI